MAGRRGRPPKRPSPTSRSTNEASPSQSSQAESPAMPFEKTMKDLIERGKARASNAPAPPAPPQPTLQDLMAQSNRTTHLEQTVFRNPTNDHRYKTQNVIGSSTSGRSTVYHGLYCVNDSDELEIMEHFELYIAARVTDVEDREEYDDLVDRIQRSREFNHPFLLQMKEEMVIENRHYLVFLLMDGSLRCLLKSVYTNGMPENVVAIVLRAVLEVLVSLHEEGHLHKELHAGHIYFRLSIPAIKIGFLPTIYKHHLGDDGQALAGTLPVSTICEWAAAPEIYHLRGEYSDKCDVWLVGITALELVFGGIQVEDRQGLERLIAKAKSGKGQTKEKVKAAGRYIKKLVIKKLKIGRSGSSASSKKRKVILSRAFRGMLKSCLAEDAEERFTANELRQHDFFRRHCDGLEDMYTFKNVVLEAIQARERSAGPSRSNEASPEGSDEASPEGSNVAGPSTQSNVAAPSSGSNAAGPSTGSNVAGPSTGKNEIQGAKP